MIFQYDLSFYVNKRKQDKRQHYLSLNRIKEALYQGLDVLTVVSGFFILKEFVCHLQMQQYHLKESLIS